MGLGVTFNSSTDKHAAAGRQDATTRRRPATRGQDDKSRPASLTKGARERSSIWTTSKQVPCQGVEHPSGMPRNAPPASTPGSTPCQCSGSMRAPRDPLESVAHYRSQGWRKDLNHIFKAYYKYNFSSFKEAEWNKLRDKVLEHLLPCQDEWWSIKENDPLQYMPYMEEQFYAATGLRLKGLAECTRWIKRGSYYHGVVARKGQLHKYPHLVGVEPPKWPQITPSEFCWASQKKAEAPAASSSAPGIETSAPQGATSDVPAPMETGGAGDGQSWVEQAQAKDDFKRDRPTKHHQSQSRRQEERPTLSFPLQDDEGRCTSAQQLYRHAGQQPLACHNVATVGISHLHPEVLPCEARSLGNQVLCMIAEYHLTSNAQGSSSLSPVLPEAARDLLPPVEDYIMGGAFWGTRDVRVVERAKTLRIATWLHHLDMAAGGDKVASQTLEVVRHRKGPLLDLLQAPMMGSLTSVEVVDCVLDKNQCRAESSLAKLIEACREESDKFTWKRNKREIDLRHKDIENLRVAISHHESNLRWGQPGDIATNDDDSSDHSAREAAESEMAIAPEADDTPSGSATTQSSDPPPAEGQAHAMEVDEKDGDPPPSSPVSLADDDLLTGGGAIGVEGDMANLTVLSSKNPDGGGKDTSI